MTPSQLQASIYADSLGRWADMTIETEGLALAEEAGEVCRAIVKRHHQTRGTSENWSVALRIEVAQTAAVLFNIAAIEGFDLLDAVTVEHQRWVQTDTNHDPVGAS